MRENNSTMRSESIIPTFRGLYLERFLRLVEAIDNKDAKHQREVVCQELVWCLELNHESVDRQKYLAMLLVLRDLMGQGWRTCYRQRSIFLTRPDYSHGNHLALDPSVIKGLIRDSFREERLARISEPSTIQFIKSLEQPTGKKFSILSLVTSGEDLVRDLKLLPENPTESDLRKVVNPYLQLVSSGTRDTYSGLRLMDIWRYFRYQWAIPYQSTPGRNLFYLIRDAARPMHPVIGIAALGNCVVQLSVRDQTIGWSVEAIEKTLQRRHRVITRDLPKQSTVRRGDETEFLETSQEHKRRVKKYVTTLSDSIHRALERELLEINIKGLATKDECQKPTDALVRRLLVAASESERKRRGELQKTHTLGESVKRTEGKSPVDEDTNSPLFVRKRAQALADILFARLVFQKEQFHEKPMEAISRILESDGGRKALKIGLHANKKTKIGSNMMDIIVCGAIPPYSEMLGGKLVAMLMASPQVVRDYGKVYGDKAGEIASRIAGKNIIRSSDLVFLTTTSLYFVGSSQYERISIPSSSGSKVAFERIGMTEGFGSTVLSTETTNYLRTLTINMEGMRRVNNIFGEGISPKMRMIRDGLALISVPQDLVLRHNCPRLVYGVRLAQNAYEYLRGEVSKPKYVFSPNHSEKGTEIITRHWLTRWFLMRTRRSESLEKLARFRPEELQLSRELSAVSTEL